MRLSNERLAVIVKKIMLLSTYEFKRKFLKWPLAGISDRPIFRGAVERGSTVCITYLTINNTHIEWL